MIRLAILGLLLARPCAAAELSLEDACFNEIELLCKSVAPGARLACLKKYRKAATPACAAKLGERAKPKAAAESDVESRLTKVSGTVYIHTALQPQGEFIRAQEGMPLAVGDEIRTGTDGKAELSMEGTSLISLERNSNFDISSLRPADTRFGLDIGALIAKIQTLLGGRKVSFHTPTAIAAVRGTELAVSQEAGDKPARVAVFDEGHVTVASAGGGGEMVLGPGQETEVAAGRRPAPAQPLAAMLGQRAGLVQVRQDLESVRMGWVSQPFEKRQETRAGLGARPALPASRLENVQDNQRPRAPQGAEQPRPQGSGARQPATFGPGVLFNGPPASDQDRPSGPAKRTPQNQPDPPGGQQGDGSRRGPIKPGKQ